MSTRVLATLLALCAASLLPAFAAEIHVSPAGDDAAPGTPDAPRRTIQAAIAKANPSDAVIIHEGTYAECLSFERAGGLAAPIRLQAAEGEEVVLDGTGLVAPAIGLGRSDYVEVVGLVIRGYVGGGILVGAAAPPWDDSRLRTDSSPKIPDADVAQGVSVLNCRMEDCSGFAVRMQATRRCVVRECAIQSVSGDAAIDLAQLADHSLVTENTISGVEPGPDNAAACGISVRGGSSFNVISENTVSSCAGYGIAVGVDCWKNVLGRNTARQNQAGGYRSSGAINAAFVWNVAVENGGPGLAIDGAVGRISLGTSAIGNVAVANAGAGILVADAAEVSIRENISSNNTGAQIRFTPAAVVRGHHDFDFNCLHPRTRLTAAIAWGTDQPEMSVGAFAQDIGIGAGNIADDPGFPDAGDDWTLPEASPCVAAGPGGENLGVNPVTPLADDVPAPDEAPLPDTADPTDLIRRCLSLAEGPYSALAARIASRAAEVGSALLDLPALQPDLVRLGTPGECSPRTRWYAIRALAALDDTSIDVHIQNATGPFEGVEAVVAAGALAARGRNMTSTIERALNSVDPWVYIVALGTRAGSDAAAGDDLVLAADSGAPHVRLYAGARLMEIGHPDADFVWQSLRPEIEASPDLQAAARAMIENGLVKPGLFAGLLPPAVPEPDPNSPNGYARAAALAQLAQEPGADAGVLRDAMTQDPSVIVRLAALEALLDIESNQAP